MKAAIAVVLWLGLGVIGAGAYRAELRYATPHLSRDPHEARAMAGVSAMFIATGPAIFVAGLAISSGFQEGWEDPFSAEFWEATP